MKTTTWTFGKQRLARGFTLVELAMVIVIIGILVIITVVGFNGVTNNAKDTALKADIEKLADVIKLETLDNQGIPVGGATSVPITGNSVVLPGVLFNPTASAYDATVSNLYYCEGTINGTDEFAIAARSTSGKAFSYISNKGIAAFNSYTWTTANTGATVCGLLGFAATFTWSYGYNPDSQYRWFAWANSSAPTIKNIVLNPRGVGTTNWFSPLANTVTATSGITWNSKSGWYRYVWGGTGNNTIRLNVALADLTNAKTYTASILVGNSGSSPMTFTMDLADAGSTNFTVAAGEMKRVYFSTSRATYDATYRFVDVALSSSSATGLLVTEAMLTDGTTQYLFRDGSSSSSGWVWTGTQNASTSTGSGQTDQ